MDVSDRLTKLKAWIYLHAQPEYWAPLGLSDAEICQLPEEKLKVVAVCIIVSVGKNQGIPKALELASELEWEIGYSEKEMRVAKVWVNKILTEITV